MNRVKLLRILLLLILAVFVAVVFSSYRTGKKISDTTADEELSRLVAGEQIIQKEFNQKNYQKEKLEYEISAREIVNYEDGINILEDFHIVRGEDGMDVRSDFGRHDQESGDAFLWENVLIQDAAGMTISTASALHHEESGTLVGDKPVAFSDSRLSGSSLGVIYNMNTKELQLPAQVELTIKGDGTSSVEPVTVHSGYMKIIKESGIAYLAQGVRLEQGRLTLDCLTLRIEFDEARRRIRHASAYGDVTFEMSAGDGSGSPGPERTAEGMQVLGRDPGRKTLQARQLEIFFSRNDSETARLEYLVARGTATEKAVLRLYPEPPDNGEVRHLEGERLVFRFRPDGPPNRLDSFHAQGGCLLRMFETGAPGAPRTEEIRLSGENLNARFDPALQQLNAAEVSGGVRFSRGQEHIRGARANYDAARGRLFITGEENGQLPRLWNDSVELEAVRIIYAVGGQLLEAEEDVWVQVKGEDGTRGLDVALFGDGADGEPVYIHADRLESDLEAGVSSFQGTVRVLKGDNVLSTRNLWLYHEDRRMEALEKVSLIIQPLAGGGDLKGNGPDAAAGSVALLAEGLVTSTESGENEPDQAGEAADEAYDRSAPLQITCHQMTYDDQARYVILDKGVVVRKHRTRMNADHMEIQLDQEENRVLHIIASAVGGESADGIQSDQKEPDLMLSGFDSQQERRRSAVVAGLSGDTDAASGPGESSINPGLDDRTAAVSGLPQGTGQGGESDGAAFGRPQVAQVTLSQPGGRSATAERILYYPGEQIAVLVGIDTIATIVDPRSGSAQGTSLTYHLADGKILNRANTNEVTLVLLHSGTSSADAVGTGRVASGRDDRGGRAASTRSAVAGQAGRSGSR